MIEVKKNNFFLNEEVNIIVNIIIKNKSLANGYIFYGAEGLGKKQAALQFIKEIFKQSSPSENVEEKITSLHLLLSYCFIQQIEMNMFPKLFHLL